MWVINKKANSWLHTGRLFRSEAGLMRSSLIQTSSQLPASEHNFTTFCFASRSDDVWQGAVSKPEAEETKPRWLYANRPPWQYKNRGLPFPGLLIIHHFQSVRLIGKANSSITVLVGVFSMG